MIKNDKIEQILKKKGLKITPKRVHILKLFENYNSPIDVNEIVKYFTAQQIPIDEVTIYRILEILQINNLIRKIDFQEGKFRYELTGTEHHHVICEKCGLVNEVRGCELGELEKQISEKQNFLVNRHSLEFFGLCANCH